MDQKLLTDFRSELLDSRFGAKAISTIAESKRFPLHEMRDDVAFQIINDELYLDGNARQNLATFCQTWDDRPALRKHGCRSVACACAEKWSGRWHQHHWFFRGLYAWRDGDEMALAQAYGSCRQTNG